jgi:hypothetical protein
MAPHQVDTSTDLQEATRTDFWYGFERLIVGGNVCVGKMNELFPCCLLPSVGTSQGSQTQTTRSNGLLKLPRIPRVKDLALVLKNGLC